MTVSTQMYLQNYSFKRYYDVMSDLERRVELCKLMIAIDSMTAVAEASGLTLALKADQNHPLYRALHDTIVSSYGRAFTEMQPLGMAAPKVVKIRR